jgi:hypothetical protein
MFEIGDKVIYQGADKAAYKREGTAVSIEDKDGQPQLTVELDGGETFTAPIDDWSRKFNNSARNAKLAVGDKVRVWQYPIRGQYGKVVKVGLMEYDVEVDGKVYPGIDYRRVVKMPAANACTSTNSVVRNAMAARNFSADDAMDAIYAAAKKMIGAGATHRTGYYWSVPKNLWKGADIVSKAAGGAVKVVRDDPDRRGFVIAEVTDPLAQALERKGINPDARPSFRMARNANVAKEFGNRDVDARGGVSPNGRKTFECSVYTGGITSSYSSEDGGAKCIKEAKDTLGVLERKVSALKQAVAWMEQNFGKV